MSFKILSLVWGPSIGSMSFHVKLCEYFATWAEPYESQDSANPTVTVVVDDSVVVKLQSGIKPLVASYSPMYMHFNWTVSIS